MIKTILGQVKEFKKDSLITPACMILEVIMEMLIPLLMAAIIDNGVEKGDMNYIYKTGAVMMILAVLGLMAGMLGAKYGASAATGLARNLRFAMFDNIQSFSFANIDKFSTAGLVTRLTTDITNVQNAYQMILRMCVRAPISMITAMAMAFFINAKLASIYLIAVIALGFCLFLIMGKAMRYFKQIFPKYDDMNASVQENVSAIRVVKAYVREDYENEKFTRASGNIYQMFTKAEKILTWNAPLMHVLRACPFYTDARIPARQIRLQLPGFWRKGESLLLLNSWDNRRRSISHGEMLPYLLQFLQIPGLQSDSYFPESVFLLLLREAESIHILPLSMPLVSAKSGQEP